METPESADGFAMKRLKKMGFELEGERSVEFYFYFPEEYQAHCAAAELNNLQFSTDINPTDDDDNWLCLATKSINFSTQRLMELRKWMQDLAKRYDGKYDGWGTGIKPNKE